MADKPEEQKVDVTKGPSLGGMLAWFFDKAFKKEAGLIIGSAVVLLIVGGSTVLYAQDKGSTFVHTALDAGLKTEAEKREALEKKLDAQIVLAKETNDRMEAKLDRITGRLEQLVEVTYELKGRPMPPLTAPSTSWVDGGKESK